MYTEDVYPASVIGLEERQQMEISLSRTIALVSNKTFQVLATIVGFSEPILNAIKARDQLRIAGFTLFGVFTLGYFISKRKAYDPQKPPAKGVFRGVGRVDRDHAWKRSGEIEAILAALKPHTGKPVFLSGTSGVGKSVLVETGVKPRLEEDWHIISITSYDSLEHDLRKELIKKLPAFNEDNFRINGKIDPDHRKNILFVFDQFEQLAALASNEAKKKEKAASEWLAAFLASTSPMVSIRHLFIVRKEYYYDLRFLGAICPSPADAKHLSGMSTKDMTSLADLHAQLQKVTRNAECCEAVMASLRRGEGEILPVEAQMVGLMLENIAAQRGEIEPDYYIRNLGGKDGLIRRYFESYLNSSPNRDIAEHVLFALSVETGMKRRLSTTQIADIIHGPENQVQESLKFFEEHGLACDAGEGKYQLAHDYLADTYHDLSGTDMDAIERDNIIYFWHKSQTTSGRLNITRPKMTGRFGAFSDYWLVGLLVLLLARLLGPLYGQTWDWLHNSPALKASEGMIDVVYLPIFISHLAWAIYVMTFYRRFFGNLDEPFFARLLSKFTVVNCAACVAAATLYPQAWIISIGCGGVGIGLKLYSLSRTRDLARHSRDIFSTLGRTTMGNCAVMVGAGLLLLIGARHFPHPEAWLVPAFYLLGIPMTYFMLVLAPKHISTNAASQKMGLFDRGRTGLSHK